MESKWSFFWCIIQDEDKTCMNVFCGKVNYDCSIKACQCQTAIILGSLHCEEMNHRATFPNCGALSENYKKYWPYKCSFLGKMLSVFSSVHPVLWHCFDNQICYAKHQIIRIHLNYTLPWVGKIQNGLTWAKLAGGHNLAGLYVPTLVSLGENGKLQEAYDPAMLWLSISGWISDMIWKTCTRTFTQECAGETKICVHDTHKCGGG